jgi:ABC-type nitrate/sulfonate/bicarbonate transport system substrate-binding protein
MTLAWFLRKASVALIAFAAWAPMQASAQQTIAVGYLAQVHDGPLLAVEKALGGEYRFDYVKFLRYTDAEIALSQGDIQVSSLGYVSAIVAAARSNVPKFKFVVGQSRGAINLVCRDDVKLRDWFELRGHTFGVLTGGPAEIFFNEALAKHGVELGQIKKVNFTVPGPPLLQSLRNKTIDCMAVYEPFAASAVTDGFGYYPPIDLADNPFRGINGGIAVNVDFAKDNKNFVSKLVDAAARAAKTLPKEKDDWIASVVAKTGFPAKTVALGTDHVVLDPELDIPEIAILATAVANLGVIKKSPTPEQFAPYFDASFLNAGTAKEVR